MKKWTTIKLNQQDRQYKYPIPLMDTGIILIDLWESLILEEHKNKIDSLLFKCRELNIPIYHACYGNKSAVDIDEKDIILNSPYATVRKLPKYLFYAGYEIDKCMIDRDVGIPYAHYENKIPILIKDLTDCISVPHYYNMSAHLMKQAAINIIEACWGFTTTFDEVMHALNHTTMTTAKRCIIETGKVLFR